MDGYALSPLSPDAVSSGEEYRLIGESRAGEPYSGPALNAGECVRIFTGAVVPNSANTVVIQEDVSVSSGEAIAINEAVRIGANIRAKGRRLLRGLRLPLLGSK